MFGYQVCPNIPWGDFSASVMTSEMGWLTLEGYEALWTLNMMLYPEHTMEYLGYLGYNSDTRGNQLTAVQGTIVPCSLLHFVLSYPLRGFFYVQHFETIYYFHPRYT